MIAGIGRRESTYRVMHETAHATSGIRFPVWCLAQVRVAISPDQSDDGLCDDTSAHRSQTNWFLIAFAALCRGSFGPFDLRFRQDVVPERCVPFEAVVFFIKRSQQRIVREVARDSLSHAQFAVLDRVDAQS